MTRTSTFEHGTQPVVDPRSSSRSGDRNVGRQLTRRPAKPRGTSSRDRRRERLDAELRAVSSRLTAADVAYSADRASLIDLERQYYRAKSKLRRDHRQIQRLLSGFFGPGVREIVGSASTVCPDNSASPIREGRGVPELIRHVHFTIEMLHRLDSFPPLPCEGPLDVPAIAAKLESGVRELEETAKGLEAAWVAVTASRSRLERALAETDRVLSSSVRFLEGAGHLAAAE